MVLSKTMEDAIEEKNVRKIYGCFYTILLADPGFSSGKFDGTLNELKERNVEGLFQSYNGKTFKEREEYTNDNNY